MSDENCRVDFNANDFLTKARMEAGEELTSKTRHKKCQYELPQLLQMTHALIVTNQEIWERCKGHLDEDYDRCVTRVSVHKVCCKTVEDDHFIEVSITPQRWFWSIEALPVLPQALLDVVPPTDLDFPSDGKFEDLPDYSKDMKNPSRLEDAVLVPFLHMFMEHLESLQVFLGEIKSWITASLQHATYLEKLFGSKIIVPEKFCTYFCEPNCHVNHLGKSLCFHCKLPFSEHTNHKCPSTDASKLRGSFPFVKDGERHVLLRRRYKLGMLDLAFNLECDKDQEKLRIFKEFIGYTAPANVE